ncbi:hypothetical protein G7Y89_g1791 [Cudoniella acicularis]|uniref:DUF6594 domain-containing protein n=1 Tax=Cudoniella acicularis TaxID=354080 RepID=A0A8H4W6N2_9HELO|nr:hypothetical protein G7Y89_g1791 [Cudoniella acicularis]
MPPSSKATNSERPKTPEDRSNYVGNKAIPVDFNNFNMASSLPSDVDLEKGIASPTNSSKFSEASTLPPNKESTRKAVIRKLDDRDKGYRSLSTFLDSDENFMLYRRFGYLHSRILLRIQDQLRELERELDAYDKADADDAEKGSEQSRKLLMSRDADEAAGRKEQIEEPGIRTRTEILDDIERKLEKYDSFVAKAQRMVALPKPADRDYLSVENYIFDKKPLIDEEAGFIYRKEDLITLRDGREMALLDAATEKMLQVFNSKWLKYIFCTRDDREKSNDPNLHYYSKSRKNLFSTAIVTLVLLALLILPVFALYKLTIDHNLEVTYTSKSSKVLNIIELVSPEEKRIETPICTFGLKNDFTFLDATVNKLRDYRREKEEDDDDTEETK